MPSESNHVHFQILALILVVGHTELSLPDKNCPAASAQSAPSAFVPHVTWKRSMDMGWGVVLEYVAWPLVMNCNLSLSEVDKYETVVLGIH